MRNIGNQYAVDDLSAETVLTYAIAHVGVQHVIVMGHYGCGAVQAAIASAPDDAHTDIGATRIEVRPSLRSALDFCAVLIGLAFPL
jgi:carbonic anhydrase